MQVASVRKLREFPVAEEDDEVKRPYRMWDSKEKAQVRGRNYKNLRHAHMGALYEAAWSKGESVFEIFDIRNGALLGQYHRYGTEIRFWRSHHPIEES